MKSVLTFLCTVVMTFACVMVELSAAQEYAVTKTINIGGEGGWDYLVYDSAGKRLFITRGTRVVVVDPQSGKKLGEIAGTEGVHGVALVPELRRGFTSNGRSSTVTVFELETLKPISQVKVGDTPDAILYDPFSHRVFTFNAKGKNATAIEAESGKVVGSVELKGKPEFAAPDGKGLMYVNIEDLHQVVVFDTEKLAVVHTWNIDGCEEPTGLSVDLDHQRLFVGCSNEKLAVVAADSGKTVATLPIGAGVDGTAFDADLQRAFSSNGSGTLTVIHELSPDKFEVVQNLQTARGARTLALDPATHSIYLVTARFEPRSEPAPGRPPMVPGSFEILVVQPK